MSKFDEIVRTACPRDCYDTCGVAVHKAQRRDRIGARRSRSFRKPRPALHHTLDRLQQRMERPARATLSRISASLALHKGSD